MLSCEGGGMQNWNWCWEKGEESRVGRGWEGCILEDERGFGLSHILHDDEFPQITAIMLSKDIPRKKKLLKYSTLLGTNSLTTARCNQVICWYK